MEINTMRELSVNEIEAVNGGRYKWIKWVIAAAEVIAEIDWGNSMDNPDTNLAP